MNSGEIQRVFEQFKTLEKDFEITSLQTGHINQTYKIANKGKHYILQKINLEVFKNLEDIVHNMNLISAHLKAKNYPGKILEPIVFSDGNFIFEKQWRLLPYFENTQTFLKVNSVNQAYEAARFISEFYEYIHDLDSGEIKDSIPGFLDFNGRFSNFKNSLNTAIPERLKKAESQIKDILHLSYLLERWNEEAVSFNKRIIHADPKISNFLFDAKDSEKPVALIDWDTIMTGPLLYDFGDMVRSYTNLKDEDNPVPGNNFSREIYKVLKEGFSYHLQDEMTSAEKKNMDLSAAVVVYIQACRFLTDYLQGDVYFNIQRPEQNLERTDNQLNLLKGLITFLSIKK